jgi:hypothetical protein
MSEAVEDKLAHAKSNAKGWYANIREMVNALIEAERTEAEETTWEGDPVDEARTAIEESVLSVRVRDGWRSPGLKHDAEPEEFEILLSTGGPALRIYGRLNEHDEPVDCELQLQDWFTPWTRWIPDDASADFHDYLDRFARIFYFGEG